MMLFFAFLAKNATFGVTGVNVEACQMPRIKDVVLAQKAAL